MKSVIDKLDSVSGWSGTLLFGLSVNGIRSFIANKNAGSLQLVVPRGSKDKYIEKTLGFAITSHKELVVNLASLQLGTGDQRNFNYKVDFGFADEYYLQTPNTLYPIVFKIPSGEGIVVKMRITVLHDVEDTLVMSHLLGIQEDLPFDVWEGVKEDLEKHILTIYDPFVVGTVTADVNDTSINIVGNRQYLSRYMALALDLGGAAEEKHTIRERSLDTYKLGKRLGGLKVLNTQAATNASIYLPVDIGNRGREAMIPGIVIWGLPSDHITDKGNELDTLYDSFTVAGETVDGVPTGISTAFSLLIDCESRHTKFMTIMARAVRRMIAATEVWVLGRKCEIIQAGTSTMLDDTDLGQIPKIQYPLELEVKESLFDCSTYKIPGTAVINIGIGKP